MATAKESAREQRARAREERRREETPADTGESPADDPGEALRNAAGAALVGAALGAAKVLARRRAEAGEDDPGTEHEPEPEVEPEPEDADEPGPQADADPRPEPEAEPEPEPEPRRAASPEDARDAVRRARDELRELHGAEADSVSAVTRTSEGWRIGLEVVEVHRVPESTDVLATYEVELTDDGGLLSFERTRRYYRSEADRQ
jgi:hypothetical protein